MKSFTVESYWKSYKELSETMQKQADAKFELWKENPFHPSLHFNPLSYRSSRIKKILPLPCLNQADATKREKYLKTYNGKRFLHNRLKSYLTGMKSLLHLFHRIQFFVEVLLITFLNHQSSFQPPLYFIPHINDSIRKIFF